jgi:hypothetical protein
MLGEPQMSSRVYVRSRPVGWQALTFIAAGLAFLVSLMLWFVRLLNRPARPGDEVMPGIIGGISVVGIGLIMRGVFLLRATARVVVDEIGVHLQTLLSRRAVRWSDIDRVERDKRSAFMSDQTHQTLRLVGKNGKPLALIDDSIEQFESLAAEVIRRSSQTAGTVTHDPAADQRRMLARERKNIRWAMWAFAVFTLLMGIALAAGINEELHVRRYATEGVRTDAKIVRRWMVKVTPRLEYSFQDQQGRTFNKQTMMYQGPEWERLEGRTTVPIEYLPSHPSWNRLVSGEDAGPSFGGKFLLLTGGGVLVFGTLFVVTMLGYDLKSENGVTSLTRHGHVIRTWGAQR